MRPFAILTCTGLLALGAAAVPAAETGPGREQDSGGERGYGGKPQYGRAALAGFASLPAQTYVPGSADFLLRVHHVRPDFRAKTVTVAGGVNLSDPRGLVPFPLTRPDRTLTGADFDVESIVRSADGSYWFGDEFGPFLLHADSRGRLVDAPVPLPGVKSPDHPAPGGEQPNLGRSKGFEGMARSVDGRRLHPLLEGTVTGDPAGSLRMYEYDLRRRTYTDRRWTYRLEDPSHAIGDAVAVDRHRFLIIERDSLQGAAARFKRVYLADTRDRDGDGALDKTQVADLLDLAAPGGGTFTFPFQTIEDVIILDDRTLGILNDNNFPFSSGRTPGAPDPNEFIKVRLTRGLNADPRVYL
ncbi:esterase-like activity of phytase family protein [Nonomuraea typhae]|uniref:esterase-like activity of phytase family protein n=1 Tax=Nonomuraea typhae TaxID=2603600 RepID=UPI0012F9BBD6|nr:esterase-like activity of phytase family protein [Nonomuraea typhae]